jgi:Tol biopolymer transport system component
VKRVLLVALLAVLAINGADAGIYYPPPGDFDPVWSPDGSAIAYRTQEQSGGLRVVARDGGGDRWVQKLPMNTEFRFSPNWSLLAYWDYAAGGIVVMRPEIGERRVVFSSPTSVAFDWSPDGGALAVAGRDGLQTVRLAGGTPTKLAEGALQPAWSPDGSHVAYLSISPRYLFVVSPAGGTPTQLTNDETIVGSPVWSPDGTRLAFTTRRENRDFVEVLRLADGSVRRFEAKAPEIAWSPDARELLLSGFGVVRLDLASGRQTVIAHSGLAATWSPDGRRIAFAAGAECKDRAGIYVVTPPAAARRLTHDCRVLGTPGDDVLTGTPLADLLLGLEGHDTLSARDDGYIGDDLLGGPGNDRLFGGFRPNLLDGGPGADLLEGGPGWDVLVGGPGRDQLDGEGARDVVVAVDGVRDDVSCGTNLARSTDAGHENDLAYVDAVDRVSRCEVVHRAPRIARGTFLTITTWPRGLWHRAQTRTLRCSPAGGTSADPATACAELARLGDPFSPAGESCVASFGTRRAFVSGVYEGSRVFVQLGYGPVACEEGRSERLAFLFRDSTRELAAVSDLLTIRVWPSGKSRPSHTWTLRCSPVGGSLPERGEACRKLGELKKPFAPVPPDSVCTQVYGGPQVALVRGMFNGRRVWTYFRRRDGCEIARWKRVKVLFP